MMNRIFEFALAALMISGHRLAGTAYCVRCLRAESLHNQDALVPGDCRTPVAPALSESLKEHARDQYDSFD